MYTLILTQDSKESKVKLCKYYWMTDIEG
jgi:hypothetical protein